MLLLRLTGCIGSRHHVQHCVARGNWRLRCVRMQSGLAAGADGTTGMALLARLTSDGELGTRKSPQFMAEMAVYAAHPLRIKDAPTPAWLPDA